MGRRDAPPYPLEAVLRQRRLERDTWAREVSDAQSDEQEKTRVLERADEALEAARRQVERIEHDRLTRTREGGRACEIQSWLARDAAARDRLEVQVARRDGASGELEASRLALERTRSKLAGALSELRAVERHRDRWLEDRRREAEKKAEEDP